jgi:hypothetical protein
MSKLALVIIAVSAIIFLVAIVCFGYFFLRDLIYSWVDSEEDDDYREEFAAIEGQQPK